MLQHKGQEIMDELKKTLSGKFLLSFQKLLLLNTQRISETVLTLCFPAALKEYLRFNGCLPSRIIVYRDGVGDGQLHSVVNYEVQQIMDSIKSMGQDCK